jgi:hypothetical protein
VAGRDVTEQMQLLLRKAGHVLHTSAEKEVVRMIKEKVCYVSLDPKREEKEWMNSYHKSDAKAIDYTLPDGHKIKVSFASAMQPTLENTPLLTLVLSFLCRLAKNVIAPLKSSSTLN